MSSSASSFQFSIGSSVQIPNSFGRRTLFVETFVEPRFEGVANVVPKGDGLTRSATSETLFSCGLRGHCDAKSFGRRWHLLTATVFVATIGDGVPLAKVGHAIDSWHEAEPVLVGLEIWPKPNSPNWAGELLFTWLIRADNQGRSFDMILRNDVTCY